MDFFKNKIWSSVHNSITNWVRLSVSSHWLNFESYLKNFIQILSGFIVILIVSKPTIATVICSATLNSDNEINALKQNLGSQVQFIELTDFKQNHHKNDSWLQRACEQNIQCDVLVISGHYTDHFFGNGLQMHLSDMENLSCSQSCDGIFKHPREVHLLGCNTLASKNSNSIRAEFPTFARELRAQGYSEQALQEYFHELFSPIGLSMETRFSLVFPNTPRILGYAGIGPTGPQIESEFRQYASRSKTYYDRLDNKSRNSLLDPNFEFLRILRQRSPFQQSLGDSYSKNPLQPAFCQMTDDVSSMDRKVKTLSESLKADPLERISLIHRWWKHHQERYSTYVLSEKLRQVLSSNKEHLGSYYKNYFKNSKNILDSIIIGELLYLSDNLNIREFQQTIQDRLNSIYKPSESRQAASVVCTAGKSSLKPKTSIHHLIQAQNITDFDLAVLKCLPSDDEELLQALLNSFKTRIHLQELRELSYITSLQKWKTAKIQSIKFEDLWSLYQKFEDVETRRYIVKTIARFPLPLTPTQKALLTDERALHPAPILQYELRLALEK